MLIESININIDRWDTKKGFNILFITGLSGSGKTTLANSLSMERNVRHFEGDSIEHISKPINSFTCDLIMRVLSKRPEYKTVLLNNNIKCDIDVIKDVFHSCVDIMKKDSNNLYIIEGVQIYSFLSKHEINNYPIIIRNESILISILRRFKRDYGSTVTEWFDYFSSGLIELIKWYIIENETLNDFKKDILLYK